jgi:spore coat protein A
MIMNTKRRRGTLFVAVAIGLCLSSIATAQLAPQTPLPGASISKFVDAVPAPPVIDARSGIPYTVTMSEFSTQVLPWPLPRTTVWGYNRPYPGPTILARRNIPARVTYRNQIINPTLLQYLAVDQTLHWADPFGLGCMMMTPPLPEECMQPYQGPVPTVVHLHGAEVPSAFDGGPESWFTANGLRGSGYVSNVYTYPNRQEATTLFYHDHALGTTRLNVFAGLSGFYLLSDPANEPVGLATGPYSRELQLQDRSFDTRGQWYFPIDAVNPDVHPFWGPEFFGDAIVVNGKTWPYLNIEPRRYRLRLLNASNARFYTLSLRVTAGLGVAPAFWQIGSDGGYLAHPVRLSSITIAPAERMDAIVDFTGLAPGTRLLMSNSANAPFPGGDPADPATTGQVMQLRVVGLTSPDTTIPMSPLVNLRPHNPIVDLRATVAGSAPGTIVPLRRLTLNEVEGDGGPLTMFVNNSRWMATTTETPRVGSTEVWEFINLTEDAHPIHVHLLQFQIISRRPFDAAAYEAAYAASFPGGSYVPGGGPPQWYGTCFPSGVCGGNPDPAPFYTGATRGPDANEGGWKDTVRMLPGEVTRVVLRWAPQNVRAGGVVPGVNLFPFDPTADLGATDAFGFPGGPGYVLHCHILDHEDNEMMRPYKVSP